MSFVSTVFHRDGVDELDRAMELEGLAKRTP